VAITAAMPGGTGLTRFAKRHPERCFDVGIAEQHAATFAAGLACQGLKPVLAIYSTFIQRAYDQIIHDVCIQHLPVVFCLDRAGVVGADGATHTGAYDLAFLRCIPGLIIMAPKDEQELRDMLCTALACNGPVAIRYPRANGLGVELCEPKALEVGHGELIHEGEHGLVISVGTRFADVQQAVRRIRETGKLLTLINLRFVKPLDEALILAHIKPGKMLAVIEEGCQQGGIGEQIAALALGAGWQGKFIHMGMPDIYVEQGTQAEVLADIELDEAAIFARLDQACKD